MAQGSRRCGVDAEQKVLTKSIVGNACVLNSMLMLLAAAYSMRIKHALSQTMRQCNLTQCITCQQNSSKILATVVKFKFYWFSPELQIGMNSFVIMCCSPESLMSLVPSH